MENQATLEEGRLPLMELENREIFTGIGAASNVDSRARLALRAENLLELVFFYLSHQI